MAARHARRWLSTATQAAGGGGGGGGAQPTPRASAWGISADTVVTLAATGWGVYCSFRVLQYKSKYATAVVQLEEQLLAQQEEAEKLRAEKEALRATLADARDALAPRGLGAFGAAARARAILSSVDGSALPPPPAARDGAEGAAGAAASPPPPKKKPASTVW